MPFKFWTSNHLKPRIFMPNWIPIRLAQTMFESNIQEDAQYATFHLDGANRDSGGEERVKPDGADEVLSTVGFREIKIWVTENLCHETRGSGLRILDARKAAFRPVCLSNTNFHFLQVDLNFNFSGDIHWILFRIPTAMVIHFEYSQTIWISNLKLTKFKWKKCDFLLSRMEAIEILPKGLIFIHFHDHRLMKDGYKKELSESLFTRKLVDGVRLLKAMV